MSLIKPANAFQKWSGQIVRYAFVAPFPSLTATVAVAEAFRGAVLSAFHSAAKSQQSFLLSGHHADHKPSEDHRHAYYLPKPDESGRIRELLVVCPQDHFSEAEISALKSVRVLRWNGPSARTSVELLDLHDVSEVRVASHWISLTPFVPVRRFWGTHGKWHLTPEKQIAKEIAAVGCECVTDDIRLESWVTTRVRIAPASATKLPDTPVRRAAYRVEFESRQPVCGPVALGHSCHFGLGLFTAI